MYINLATENQDNGDGSRSYAASEASKHTEVNNCLGPIGGGHTWASLLPSNPSSALGPEKHEDCPSSLNASPVQMFPQSPVRVPPPSNWCTFMPPPRPWWYLRWVNIYDAQCNSWVIMHVLLLSVISTTHRSPLYRPRCQRCAAVYICRCCHVYLPLCCYVYLPLPPRSFTSDCGIL